MWRAYLLLLFMAPICSLGKAAEPRGQITIVSHVDVLPDVVIAQAEERAAGLFKAEISATKLDKGLVSYVVLRQIDRPNHFTIVETWLDSTAYAAHIASAHTITFRKGIQDYLGSPFDARIHQAFP